MPNIKIHSIGTALPDYRISQSAAREFAATLFRGDYSDIDRLLFVFDNAGISARYVSCPLDWYGRQHSFTEANSIYEEVALKLAEQASAAALKQGGVSPADIGMVIFVSSTGIATPTLDAKLIQRLNLSRHAARLPVWGLGCAGGVAGLARAFELAKAVPGRTVLLVTVELCSLTFQHGDRSKSNLVGASIFADGAAAVILKDDGCGPALMGSFSTLFDDSEDIMGWDVVESGLKVRFSRDIPTIVRKNLPGLIEASCRHWGIARPQLRHFVVHPGGAKVLQSYMESLNLPPESLRDAFDSLKNNGNMSSSSVLFVLEKFLARTSPTGDYGIMVSLGPGFCSEQVLFKW